jgi:hypothetical protein
MRKKDRTGEEKHWDAIVKSGLMRLGENPTESPNPFGRRFEVAEPRQSTNPFPHVLVWDRMGRKGQKCRVITPKNVSKSKVQVQFEDGYIAMISRQAIRRSD